MSVCFVKQSDLTEVIEEIRVKKVPVLAVFLVVFVLAAAGFWTLALLRRARPEPPLERAAVSGSVEELRRELRRHQGANGEDASGFTALDWAVRAGKTDAIHELVQEGADPELRDSGPNGWTPLLHAVHKNQLESVRALLTAGAAPDARGDNGVTPLMLAASQGEPEIAEELMRAGADPRLRGPLRSTALERAVAHGHSEMVAALLRRHPELRLGDGPRAWAFRGLAWAQGRSEVLDRLDARGAGR